MFRTIGLLVVIMGTTAAFVNAESTTSDAARLKAFVEHTLRTGFDTQIETNLAPHLGFQGQMPSKADGTDPDEAQDAADRNCLVVTEASATGPKPVCLLFKAAHYRAADSTTKFVKLGLDGKPELVMIQTGQMANGHGVAGSAHATYLDLKSNEAKAIIKYELDFWLRKMHRTKLGQLRLTNPKATMADVKAAE